MTAALADAVGTLRIRTSHDEPAVRSAVSGAVRRARLRPSGRSPRAVLVVRRLEHRIGWAPGMPAATWPTAPDLGPDIDAMWRLAARPATGAVPPAAPAVLFVDLVELLTVLVEDLAAGEARDRWWWDVVGRDLAPRGRVAEVFVRRAPVVPAVISELDRRGTANAVVAALTEGEAAEVTAAVAAAYGAPRIQRLAPRSVGCDPAHPLQDAAAPWSAAPGAGSSDPLPSEARRMLVTVARLASTADSELRSVGFAERVERWLDVRRAVAPEHEVPVRGTKVGTNSDAPAPAASVSPPPVRPVDDRVGAAPAAAPDVLPVEAGPGRSTSDEPFAAPATCPPEARASPGRDDPSAPGAAREAVHRSGEGAEHPADDEAAMDPDTAGVVTGLGGVFFLVDLLRELDLPDVFEDRWMLASRLGGWCTLELLARSLVPADPPWPHDPVWQVLADLGGGLGALAPERALPARVVAELPPSWRAMTVRSTEPPPLAGTLAGTAAQGRRRWLELVRPFVVGLLVDRLGVEPDELFDAVLARPARLDVDRTHVDVTLPLATATVAVRRAGLDRDPGWVPQLGRVVLFHFEQEVAGQ